MMLHFVPPGLNLADALSGLYEIPLLFLSLLAAYLGSFAGLAVIRPLSEAETPVLRKMWLLFGAVAFGNGVFAMHFIGMLAFKLPVAVHYDLPLTLLSGLPAVLAAGWMLYWVEKNHTSPRLSWFGGAVGGGGIGLMHYTGMMAMELEARMLFDPRLFAVSILAALLLAVLAIHVRHLARWLGLDPDRGRGRQIAPLVMAAAISSMHYIAMAATVFVPGKADHPPSRLLLDPLILGIGLAIVFFILVASFLLAFALDGNRPASKKMMLALSSPFEKENRPLFARSTAIILGVFLGIAWVVISIHNMTSLSTNGPFWSLQNEENHLILEFILLFGIVCSLFIAWIVTLFIVTRRLSEKAESDALRELTFQKKALDEHAIVSATDVRGNIIYVNEKFVAISGYSREELLGQNHRMVKSDEHPPAFYKEMWKTITSGHVWHGEVKNRAKDGSFYWVRATIVPFLNEKGKPFQYVSIRTDITAMKALEANLTVAKEQAEAAGRAKSDFLANMSHEIRTPMNAIIGLSHLCLQTQLTTRQKDYIHKVHNSATSLLRIINDILDFSKIEAGRLDMESIDFTLEEVLGTMASMTSLKAQEKRLEFLMETAGNIPPSLIGDPLRLGQILINLANNAIKFTETGEVVVITELLEKTENAVHLQFTVRDTGIGMTAEQVAGLFQAFSQADSSVTRKYGGTGLGLTIAKRLIEMMGGTIRVESVVGQGTRFIFDVYLGYTDQAIQKVLLPTSDLRGLRVLAVDDNESARNVITDYLTSFTFKVTKACDAKEAIIAVQEADMAGEPFDLLITDYMMPEMDGITAVATMRKELSLSRFPLVIMATAYGEERVVKRASQEALVDGFLVKPINQSLLFESIMEVFGHVQGGEQKGVTNTGNLRDFLTVLSGARLLLVEDNEINQQVARELLEQANITVLVAQNGKEAVELVAREALDGVLMDLQMPVMDGLTATRIIRKESRFANLPILAMTANAMSGDRELCLEAGMQDHIAKPVDPDAMYATLARWIKPASPKPVPARHRAGAVKGLDGEEEPSSVAMLPEIPGVDVQAGLRRMGGNIQGYRNLLAKFRTNQGEAATAIRVALAAAEQETAERLAHTLKGVAGAIGAGSLEERAKQVESAIKNGVNGDQMAVGLQKMAEELATLCTWLDQIDLLTPPAPQQTIVTSESDEQIAIRTQLFNRAAQQLAQFDAEVEHTLAKLRCCTLSQEALAWVIQLEAQVTSYDFEGAATTIQACADALGMVLDTERNEA